MDVGWAGLVLVASGTGLHWKLVAKECRLFTDPIPQCKLKVLNSQLVRGGGSLRAWGRALSAMLGKGVGQRPDQHPLQARSLML